MVARKLLGAVTILAALTQGVAAEATLATDSQAAYADSLVEMAKPLGEEQSRELILQLLLLATGDIPDGVDPATYRFEAMAQLMDDPQLFLDGIKPYEGMTAAEIMALPTE